jgi:metal-sulfur cluster biosynthetic enzyme
MNTANLGFFCGFSQLIQLMNEYHHCKMTPKNNACRFTHQIKGNHMGVSEQNGVTTTEIDTIKSMVE